jgi:hypothetical protein
MRKPDWPQEIPKKPMTFATFIPFWERPPRVSAQRKRPGNDAAHLANLRRLACAVPCCTGAQIDAHHLKFGPAKPERSFGRKATDRWALPICRAHHDELEARGSRREPEFWAECGLDAPSLCIGLWNAKRDAERMRLVLRDHQQQAIRTLSAAWRKQQ